MGCFLKQDGELGTGMYLMLIISAVWCWWWRNYRQVSTANTLCLGTITILSWIVYDWLLRHVQGSMWLQIACITLGLALLCYAVCDGLHIIAILRQRKINTAIYTQASSAATTIIVCGCIAFSVWSASTLQWTIASAAIISSGYIGWTVCRIIQPYD